MTEETDELLDLVNADDRVVGTVMREEHHAAVEKYNEREQYFRGTNCFLLNSEGKIWVPRRQPWRKVAPDSLDFSMAEHVQSGESHLEGARRGMQEELNLDVDPSDLIHVHTSIVDEIGCMMSTYIYKTNTTPNYSKDDYQDAWWMTPQELLDKIAAGDLYKSALPDRTELLIDWLKNA